ncbi:MAG: TIGR03546 family protein [Kangiellaceae bacterium]
MLTSIIKLLKALNSEQSPGQLAIAISLAAILGLTPLYSLHNVLVIFIALSFRVNLSVLLISYPIFALLGYLFSNVFDSIGISLLQNSNLLDFWQGFFNTLIGRWSNFYYSGVIGSLTASIIVAILLYPLSKIIINLYREKFLVKIEKYQIVKVLKASSFWKLYEQSK